MRFIVYGAGAVGGVLGAYLQLSGHDVVLVARDTHLAAMQTGGLTLRTPSIERTIPVAAVGGPDQIDWRSDDVLLVTVKAQDTAGVLHDIAAHADPEMAVVCLQNGVNNEREALRQFNNVYGVCVVSPTTHLEPGIVLADSEPVPGLLDIGRYPAGSDSTASTIAEAFRRAGYQSEVRDQIMPWKYGKLLRNVANAVDAVCGQHTEGADELIRQIEAEAIAVYQAADISYIGAAEDAERRAHILKVADTPGGRGGGSSWQSLARGSGSIESDYLNGEIVLLGRTHGVPTPWNENALRWANLFARTRRAPGSLTPPEWCATMP